MSAVRRPRSSPMVSTRRSSAGGWSTPSNSRLPLRLLLWWHLSALAGSGRRSRGLWGDVRAAAARGGQLVHSDRLAEVVVHPRGQTGLALLLHGAGGRRDDVRPSPLWPSLVDAACGLQPVHRRHLHVHEHDVVGPRSSAWSASSPFAVTSAR